MAASAVVIIWEPALSGQQLARKFGLLGRALFALLRGRSVHLLESVVIVVNDFRWLKSIGLAQGARDVPRFFALSCFFVRSRWERDRAMYRCGAEASANCDVPYPTPIPTKWIRKLLYVHALAPTKLG